MRVDLRIAGVLSLFTNVITAIEVDWNDEGMLQYKSSRLPPANKH